MRGWGSSVLAIVGVVMLWFGVTQFEGAYVPETGTVSGKVARIVPLDGRLSIMFAEPGPAFVLPASTLPVPPVQALADAASVTVIYDKRSYAPATHGVVGLSVDGHLYFSPSAYQAFALLLALIVLVPGTMMFAIGISALYGPKSDPRAEALEPTLDDIVEHTGLVIPFRRRPQSVEIS
jgi:hypothetical protein